jgi:hypothetical protein
MARFKALNKALPISYSTREACPIDGTPRNTEHIFLHCRVVRKVRRLLNLMLIHVHADVIGDEIQDLLLQRVSHPLQTALHLNLSHVLFEAILTACSSSVFCLNGKLAVSNFLLPLSDQVRCP